MGSLLQVRLKMKKPKMIIFVSEKSQYVSTNQRRAGKIASNPKKGKG